jgi:hypothetical protein
MGLWADFIRLPSLMPQKLGELQGSMDWGKVVDKEKALVLSFPAGL